MSLDYAQKQNMQLNTIMQDLCNLSDKASCDSIESLRVALKDVHKKTLIENHKRNNAIFESNGFWFTHFVNAKGKRSTIRRKTKEELEDALYQQLIALQTKTIADVFNGWIQLKRKETTLSNVNKLEWVWSSYFDNTAFANKKIDQLSVADLKEELIDICRKHSLTSRQAKEMKSLINGIYDYAIEHDWVSNNIARNIVGFAKDTKDYITVAQPKTLNEEVFSNEEEAAAIKRSVDFFEKTGNTIYLGIILNFLLGLRVGELIALQFVDFNFDDHFLHLCRSEVRCFSEDGSHKNGFEIKPFLKKHVAFRDIPIGNEVQKIVELIRATNANNGLDNSEWLFVDKLGNIKHSKAFHKALSRINVTEGILQKSNHKIRKTVISKLINSGRMSIVDIRDFAGHQDAATTFKFYGRKITTNEATSEIVDDILGTKIAL